MEVKCNDDMKVGINTFDFDGVVSIGIHPGPNDVIITGRTWDEADFVKEQLESRGITNKVFFNPVSRAIRTREMSGAHKAAVIGELIRSGSPVSKHFEDDPLQILTIKAILPDLDIVFVSHSLTEK